MKFIKYQQDVIKEVLKNNSKARLICWKEKDIYSSETNAYCTIDGFLLMCIPEKLWALDMDRLKEHLGIKGGNPTLKNLVDFDNRMEAILANEKRDETDYAGNKKRPVVKIKAVGDDTKFAWVDERLLKYFDNPTFTLSKERPDIRGINVYEGETFVGMVMPVRISEI